MGEKQPFFSIVIPNYGGEEYFAESTGSVLSQAFRDIELILVDDCSPGEIPQMCDDLAKADNRVKVLHREVNGGLSVARNSGAEIAKGEYIAFLDNDDYFLDGVFQRVYDKITACHASNSALPVDILQCDSVMEIRLNKDAPEREERISTQYPSKRTDEDKTEYVLKRYIKGQIEHFIASRYYRLDLIKNMKIRCNSRYDSIEDFDFALKAYLNAQRVENLNAVNFAHVCRDGSMSLALSTGSCISRINAFADWFDYVEGLPIDKTIKKAFLERMAKEISKIWLFASTGKNCREDVDKKLIWSTPAEQQKYIKYIPVASPLPHNPFRWPGYIKKTVRKRRRKRRLLKKGALTVFSEGNK